MNVWEPSRINSEDWFIERNLKQTHEALRFEGSELRIKAERRLIMGGPNALPQIEYGAICIWILLMRWLRSQVGHDLGIFAINSHLHLKHERGRVRIYLCDINYIICHDEAIRLYLDQISGYKGVDYVMHLALLLEVHPRMKKLFYSGRRASTLMAALMVDIGVDKFRICPDQEAK